MPAPDWIPAGCGNCRHFDRMTRLRCAAYPNGIPLPMQWGEFDHRKPAFDDSGIQWEPSDQLLMDLREAGILGGEDE